MKYNNMKMNKINRQLQIQKMMKIMRITNNKIKKKLDKQII